MSDICAELEIDILKAGVEQLEADKTRLIKERDTLRSMLQVISIGAYGSTHQQIIRMAKETLDGLERNRVHPTVE